MGGLHEYLNAHSGEAPSVEEFKQLLETNGCLSGDTAAIWQLILDSFTRCSSFVQISFVEVDNFKAFEEMLPCLKEDDPAINKAVKKLPKKVKKEFGKQHHEVLSELIEYLKAHEGQAPSAEEFKSIL
jgi:hypothetical protein